MFVEIMTIRNISLFNGTTVLDAECIARGVISRPTCETERRIHTCSPSARQRYSTSIYIAVH
jgi:hypothetical protein